MTKALKILLAEDNPLNVKLAIHNIENRLGHKVTVANNGKEAVNLYKSGEYDYILMDIEMPELNGIEATKIIRQLEKNTGKKTKIIAMTAYGHEEKSRFSDAGMDDYFCKPYKTNILKNALS